MVKRYRARALFSERFSRSPRDPAYDFKIVSLQLTVFLQLKRSLDYDEKLDDEKQPNIESPSVHRRRHAGAGVARSFFDFGFVFRVNANH